MTDRKQFEAMLEALINEDQETAKEIFHNIVVAKSREIYEELLSEDFELEEEAKDKKEDEEDKNVEDEDEEKVDETYNDETMEASEEEEGEEEEGEDSDVGGDAGDKFVSDVEDSETDGEDMSDDEQTDRILDLEDALEELKAEFEQLMADEGEGEPAGDDMSDMGDAGGDLAGADMGMDDMPMSKADEEFAQFMEYVDKVALPKHGDNGANSKSVVAGKNDMGGTTANIAKGGESKGEGTKGGLLNPSTKEDNAGNVNVPGAKSATKLSSVGAGHGAEKKGKAEQADNKKSIVGSR